LKFAKFTIAIAFTIAAAASLAATQDVTLQPSMEQRFTSNLATKLLTNWHYKTTRLDDGLSERILDGYLEMLDPNRSYFLAADVAGFDRYR
jgi:carboxyl-terminal processing protease